MSPFALTFKSLRHRKFTVIAHRDLARPGC